MPPTSAATLVRVEPAGIAADILHIEYLAADWAGSRLVTVGERGTIALSDDGGRHFRQAKVVPIQATLTAVHFVDAKVGWAVGHWGSILRSDDGGETWTLQHSRVDADQPFFSVYFADAQHGWAVGLWALMMETRDGGATWENRRIPPSPDAAAYGDLNLYSISPLTPGSLLVTGERGTVMRSDDNGVSWRYLNIDYHGSLWIGKVLRNGDILVGGLRGSLYCSRDQGASWTRSETGTSSSITGIAELADGTIVASALDGVSLWSSRGCGAFIAAQRPDRVALTAVAVDAHDRETFFSKAGVVVDDAHEIRAP